MNVLALLGLGFSGLASNGFVDGGSSPIDAAASEPLTSYFNTSVAHARSSKSQVSAPGGLKIPIHKESDFSFVVIVADNGQGKGGGWQEAKASLLFIKITDIPPSVIKWKCSITIGMPIRHSTMGVISPSRAADMSTTVTNAVTIIMDFDLPQGIFCHKFRIGVEKAFPLIIPDLGERVSS